jgi:hypothetical protein
VLRATSNMRIIVLTGCLAVLAGCSTKKIPGTDIDDTSETRAILDVLTKYRSAVELRNPQALLELADESFRDDGGSAAPDDDLDYRSLHTSLPARMLRFDDIRLDVNVRKVEFDEAQTNAKVTYTYTMSFRMPQYTSRTQSETDIKQMFLKRGAAGWKITSGI